VIPSPDLKQVAYVWHEGSNPGHLRVIPNQPGAKPRVLVQNAEFPYVLPSGWSPDGKSILVHMWKKDYTAQLAWVYLLAADGSSEKELVGGSGVNEAPVWTPDGSGILFLSDRSGTFDLWKTSIDGVPTKVKADVGDPSKESKRDQDLQ
jgi:TolB protein